MTSRLVIVIPAYDPISLFTDVVKKLNDFFKEYSLIIVNDGSTKGLEYFTECSQFENVTVLKHEVNKGKGEALKTAFKYIKNNFSDCVIVTADSDGQHTPEDIKKVYDFYLNNDNALVLGSRKFDGNVPKKSIMGNTTSRILSRLILNKYFYDNQTGLRAFGSKFLDLFINIPGSRYEYEMNMLNEAIRKGIPIEEVTIHTVYINNNQSTHFNPWSDFPKICCTILKYVCSVLFCSALNLFLLAIFIHTGLFSNNLFLIFTANLISVAVYFIINRCGFLFGNRYIFKAKNRALRTLAYIVLMLILSALFSFTTVNSVLSNLAAIAIGFILILFANYNIIKKLQLHD